MIKKTPLLLSILSFFAVATTAYAQAKGFTALAPIPDLTTGKIAAEAGLASFFNNLYKYLIGLAATLAVIQITWAGFEIAFNKEDVSKITDSKGKIYNALLGLVLVLSPVLVFTIINPSILNLSLNLPPLDTKFTPKPSATTPLPGGGTGYGGGTIAPSGQYCFNAIIVASIGKNYDVKAQLQCYPDMKSCIDNKRIMEADKKTYLVPESSLCLLTQKLK